MKTFDTNPNVISWSSEEVKIPYKSPIDNKIHNYFPDFLIEVRNKQGHIDTLLIEVKPSKQTQEPAKPKKKKLTRSYITEVKSYVVNMAKWEAAQSFCVPRGWKFKILTEKDIF